MPQLDAATHALINYTPAKKVRWDPMIRSHTRKGTWFVTFDWIDECIREGELVAETCCLIPGGRTLRPRPIIRSDAGPSRSVPNRDIPTPHADGQSQQAAAIPNGVGIPARPSGALALPEKPVSASKASQDSSRRTEPVLPQGINDRDDIHQLIIRRVHLLDTGWTLERLCQRLAQMVGSEADSAKWGVTVLIGPAPSQRCRGLVAGYISRMGSGSGSVRELLVPWRPAAPSNHARSLS